MSFFEAIFDSIALFFKAIPFTFRHFAWVLVIPFLLFLLIFYLTFMLESSVHEHVSNWLLSLFNNEGNNNWITVAITYVIKGVLFLLFKLMFLLFFFFFSGNIVLILLSPALAYISEKTEKILTNKTYPFSFSVWFRQIGRSIVLSLRNLFIQLLLTLSIFIISFIPIIGWIISPFSIILIILINSYFLGFSFMDFSFERKELSIHQSVNIVRKNKGVAIGFGLVYFLFFLIPFIGNFLIPFIAFFTVVGATMSVEKMKLHD